MFIILLTYTKPIDEVDQWLTEHKAWLKRGFDDGIFVLAGGQRPRVGGALIAIGSDRAAIEELVALDPFVLQGVATAAIIEVIPSMTDKRLDMLKSG